MGVFFRENRTTADWSNTGLVGRREERRRINIAVYTTFI